MNIYIYTYIYFQMINCDDRGTCRCQISPRLLGHHVNRNWSCAGVCCGTCRNIHVGNKCALLPVL